MNDIEEEAAHGNFDSSEVGNTKAEVDTAEHANDETSLFASNNSPEDEDCTENSNSEHKSTLDPSTVDLEAALGGDRNNSHESQVTSPNTPQSDEKNIDPNSAKGAEIESEPSTKVAMVKKTVKNLFKNPWFCRSYFLFQSFMEAFDIVSDWLWLVALSLYSVSSQNQNDDAAVRFYNRLFIASLFIAVLSTILLGSKFFDDLRGITDKSREYLKLEIPVFSAFYLMLASDEQVMAWLQQRRLERKVTQENVIDALVGIHREDNYLDRELFPVVKCLFVGSVDPKQSPVQFVWQGAFYPLRLLFSPMFCRGLGCCLAACLYPLCGFVTLFMSAMWMLVVVMNFCFRSHHVYTIRILEDVPQFVISVVYLSSPYAGQLDGTSLFSLLCSGILLTKAICEMAWWYYTSKSVSKLSQRRIVVSDKHRGLQVFYITFLAPIAVHTVVITVYASYVIVDTFFLPIGRAVSKACRACRSDKIVVPGAAS